MFVRKSDEPTRPEHEVLCAVAQAAHDSLDKPKEA